MVQEKSNKRTWTTEDELEYINNLSPELLESYKAALPMRCHWGNINSQKIYIKCGIIENVMRSLKQ